ncbi:MULTISPECIES: bestrophin family protein [unclassified Novosphingobium]|uniref:bestrophin family protein n=1 Tax=unclassified Novosphingobium TaxID=2644732 RepID=UPI0003B53E1A|nr:MULTISPECIES: bestrophin family ion channel [unclassified Novosphingobium]MBB3358534.1 putative membrane protein [Novosphingobium sp. BK256]MBB3374895.1 putative membrane protein [Novosphingobium sp. BK280]MBB3379416.1 putative membrane protein [Novosphingobium sp. BK258]MBB3421111.1 putative membrane protein [Novosphingobium sp. BK267]MBB3449316.1 putative membrane protein [Novosphingobium sp. BK352]
MIVGKTPRIRMTFVAAWNTLLALFVWDVAVTVFYYFTPFPAPALPLTIFGTGLALLLGFRVNSAYARWWEGRIVWGAMTNASRSLARAVGAALPDHAAGQAMRHDVVRRHIAYVHVLRHQLRGQDPAESAQRVLGDAEIPELARRNPANGLLEGNGMRLASALRQGWIDTVQLSRIEAIMVDISNAQGAMERLRNTPLPAQYRSFPTFFTRLFCVLLPIGLVETLGPATPLGSALAGFMFLAALQIGDDLVNPFANTIHDAPLTAMCATIESDCNESLGLPPVPVVQPEGGILW